MKLVKMSLVAAMLMGASAFAIENTKISGDAQVFYQTTDQGEDVELFDKGSSSADAALHLNLSTDLLEGVTAGASYTAISTLGLENNFVSNVWAGSHTATTGTGARYGSDFNGAKVENASWFNEAWVAATLGKTTAKVGRMALDTPLAFTETWTIEQNTFEGAVLLNQDLPDTTLVAAWVGNGNGTESFGDGITNPFDANATVGAKTSNVYQLGLATGGIVNADGEFSTYGSDGAYAFGVVNNSFKPLTVQAWYYDVSYLAQAYWLQADLNMEGIIAGVQYSNIDAGDIITAGDTGNDVYAVMLGYSTDAFTIKGAYSATGKNNNGLGAGFNTATATGGAQSKLYTEAWWFYGSITQEDTSSFNITAETAVGGYDLAAYYTNADKAGGDAGDMDELTLSAGTSFGPLDVSLVYINAALNQGDRFNIAQAYLTLNY